MIGTIEAPKVVIHEGAVLQGHCQTGESGQKSTKTVSLELEPDESDLALGTNNGRIE